MHVHAGAGATLASLQGVALRRSPWRHRLLKLIHSLSCGLLARDYGIGVKVQGQATTLYLCEGDLRRWLQRQPAGGGAAPPGTALTRKALKSILGSMLAAPSASAGAGQGVGGQGVGGDALREAQDELDSRDLDITIRAVDKGDKGDVHALRLLVNAAYRELADMGLNYTGSYQDDRMTARRLRQGDAYVLERDGQLVGTVLLSRSTARQAYISQLAVDPAYKGQGLGSLLMDLAEGLARQRGYSTVGLDTAQPADHLVQWYQRRGYAIVGTTRHASKSYSSYIFAKAL